MQKYEYLIELGKSLPLINQKYKTQANIITGCQSQVWMHSELIDKHIVFEEIKCYLFLISNEDDAT